LKQPRRRRSNCTNTGYINELRLTISLCFKYGLIMPYGAGCVTVVASRVTAVCANSLPALTTEPVTGVIAF